VLCIMVFFVIMAMRPAPAMAQQTPIYGPDGKYQGSRKTGGHDPHARGLVSFPLRTSRGTGV